jgi:hypothetical protein
MDTTRRGLTARVIVFIQDCIQQPDPAGSVLHTCELCDEYVKGKSPVPASYMPAGYADVDAVDVRVGNHLIDPTSRELQKQGNFSQTSSL